MVKVNEILERPLFVTLYIGSLIGYYGLVLVDASEIQCNSSSTSLDDCVVQKWGSNCSYRGDTVAMITCDNRTGKYLGQF